MEWLPAKSPLIIAHRGASADAPENSLAAFGLAAEQGADGIELDVRLSADGHPVVIHDGRVDRTTNGTGRVDRLTMAELQALELAEGETIPALHTVFEVLGPRLLYFIEIKDFSWRGQGIETAVADLIQAFHLENRALVSSFNPFVVRRARQSLSSTTPVALIRAPGLLKFTYLLAEGEADHPHHSLVDASYMAWARKRGYRVHAWTVDDAAEAQRLVDLGVDGIATNKPQFIRESLEK